VGEVVHVEGTTADKESKEAVVKFIVAQTDAAIRHQNIYLITFCPRPPPLLLRLIHHNPINIRALIRLVIEQPPNPNLIHPLLQVQQQRRTQYDTLVRIPLIQRLHLLRLIIHHNTADAAQLPATTDTIRRAAGLVAEAHIVGVLVVKGYPLRFPSTGNIVERHGTLVPINTRRNNRITSKHSFLMPRLARRRRVLAVIRCALDGRDFARFDVQVIDVVPFDLEGFLGFVDFNGQPYVARFPERDGVPLVAEVEVRRFLGAVDAHREAGLRVEGARIEGGDDEGLGPGAGESVGAEGDDVYRRLAIIG
jgi:hypothetical protein